MKQGEDIEARLTSKGAYAQHFKWVDHNGRRIKQNAGKDVFDVEGYFQTRDSRADELFDNDEQSWKLEFPLFGVMEEQWILIRRTRRAGVFAFRSSP